MSSDDSALDVHFQLLQSLTEIYSFVFDASLIPYVPLSVDVKTSFYVVKQKLYFEKEKWTRFISNPIYSVLTPGQAIILLAVVTELLRIVEVNSDLYTISMYKVVADHVSGSLHV